MSQLTEAPASADPDGNVDRLFGEYRLASDTAKVVIVGELVRGLREMPLVAQQSAAIDRAETLLAMMDRDHIDDLDIEVAALRLNVLHSRLQQTDRR